MLLQILLGKLLGANSGAALDTHFPYKAAMGGRGRRRKKKEERRRFMVFLAKSNVSRIANNKRTPISMVNKFARLTRHVTLVSALVWIVVLN